MQYTQDFLRTRIRPTALCVVAALASGCGSGIHAPATSSGSAIAAAAGPQLGYFWNPADQTLRPVLGIPGASQIGASVVAAGLYTTGAGSASSQLALLQESDGSLDVMSLPSGQPSHLSAQTAPGAQIRFSPLGQSAVLFKPGNAGVLLVTGLNTSPAVSTVTATASLVDAAVSDTGTLALVSAGTSGSQVQISAGSGSLQPVATVGAPGGISFSGTDLVFADSSANTLSILHLATSSSALSTVPTAGLLAKPTALAVAPGGQWALVTNSGNSNLVRIDLTGQNAPLRIACACTPTSAVALSGNATFRVTDPGSGPIWAVEAAVATPRSFFIPALPVQKP